jgi:hypothetical protein
MQAKIEKYRNIEKMINDFDKRIGGEEDSKEKEQNKNIQKHSQNEGNSNINKDKKKNKIEKSTQNVQDGKYLNNKRPRKTSEEILKEKEEKLLERKKTFMKLNKKTTRGQPVMKYQMEHIFNKIKSKLQNGTI